MKILVHSALGFLVMVNASAFAAEAKKKTPTQGESKTQTEAVAPKEEVKTEFTVQDIPAPEPIEGQLGGPGAPSLQEQQALLAKALLSKGLCNVSFYGEEFCEKQQKRKFKVTDQIGATSTDTELLGKPSETF